MSDELRITVEDLRTVRNGARRSYCIPGFKAWAAENGLSYRRLLSEGIPVSEMDAIGGPYAARMIKTARERAARAQQ